ncbi:MAG: aminotransferase class I/II-fold pyridoxal phosphate-dependent enzyme [Candidatus Thermoplasmatota archaeon]
MNVRPFGLERFVVRGERSARFILGSSGVAPFPLGDVPGLDVAAAVAQSDTQGDDVFARAVARARGVPVEHVVPTVGDTEAIFLALFALVNPHDRVLVESPAYFPFVEIPRVLGASVERFDRSLEDHWRIDVDDLIARLDDEVSVVVLANPNNPSGQLTPARDIVRLAEACEEVDAWLLVDDIFRTVVQPRPPVSHSLHSRIVTAESLTKAHGLSTLRAGWLLASPELMPRLHAARGLTSIHAGGLLPRLAAQAIVHEEVLLRRTFEFAHQNLARFRVFMHEHHELAWREPECQLIAAVRLPSGTDDLKFCELLLEEEGVMVVPGSFLELPGSVRFGFGAEPVKFEEGLRRVGAFLSRLRQR